MAQLLGTYAAVFSAENAQKGLSLLKDKEGTEIAAPIVTLVDDPFYEKSAMPFCAFSSSCSPVSSPLTRYMVKGRTPTLAS